MASGMEPFEWRRITAALSEEALAGGHTAGKPRQVLEAEHGQVWSGFELARDYEVEAFHCPYVVVVRRSDGRRGTLFYQDNPRFYWGFRPQ